MITIKNLRNEKPKEEWQVKVDRSSVLGNPFIMNNENERQFVCNQYENWFNNGNVTLKIPYEKLLKINDELERLKELYKKYNKLELFCWCAPKRCHAETIKEYLLK